MSLYDECISICQDIRNDINEEGRVRVNAIQRGLVMLLVHHNNSAEVLEEDPRGTILYLMDNLNIEHPSDLEATECEKMILKLLNDNNKNKNKSKEN